ncbi:hypothetical protein JCM5350_007177 [Sporobolomyces pararoseus]
MEAARKETTFQSVKLSRTHGTLNASTTSDDDDVDGLFLSEARTGTIQVSTHHLIFERSRERSEGSGKQEEEKGTRGILSSGEEQDYDNSSRHLIPWTLIHSVTRTPPSFTGQPNPISILTRDFYTYSIEITSQGGQEEVDRLFETIKESCGKIALGGLENRSAFQHYSTSRKNQEKRVVRGWEIYNPKKEFERMGIGKRTKAWRFTNLNTNFNFCPSYPAEIIVPSKISDTTLNYAVKYRSKSRIPGLVYLHWANQGSITRSSQPMVGITQTSRSIQDEKLIEAIFNSHSQHSGSRESFTVTSNSNTTDSVVANGTMEEESGGIVYGAMATNVIIDARPTKNAYANSVKGAGTENMTFYKNCRKEYLGIDNIHVMRSSLNGVFQALTEAETSGHLDRSALRRTNWLSHLTNILEGTLIVIRTIHLSNSHVLVHCSDGWDRTSQLSSLPQICLDPFYRTAKGLAVLIEKDWLSYGHKFTDRSGLLCPDRIEFLTKSSPRGEDHQHQQSQTSFLASVQKQFNSHTTSSSHLSKEVCPVFQQFLDCVYQIQKQFPERFEWNEKLLRKLVWETYSGQSGTFLFNSEMERSNLKAKERTKSVWEEVFDLVDVDEGEEVEEGEGKIRLKPEYLNPLYDPTLDDPNSKSPSADQGVLLFDPQRVKYWFELFGRSDEEMNQKPLEQPRSPPPPPPPLPEHRVVISPQDDPVLNNPLFSTASKLVSSLSLNPSSTTSNPPLDPSVPSSATSRSTSPLPSRTNGNGGIEPPVQSQQQQQQLTETVQKFGWSAWKSVQKFGQEAAKQYKERTTVSGGDQSIQGELSENGWNSTNRTERNSNEGIRADFTTTSSNSGQSSGMWSRFSTLSTNPWQQQQQEQPQQPQEQETVPSSPSFSYTPYQPRRTTTSSQHNQAPHPVRQPSSALSINPWETISKEDALPPSTSTSTTSSIPSTKPSRELNSEGVKEPTTVGGSDPLGVGGF